MSVSQKNHALFFQFLHGVVINNFRPRIASGNTRQIFPFRFGDAWFFSKGLLNLLRDFLPGGPNLFGNFPVISIVVKIDEIQARTERRERHFHEFPIWPKPECKHPFGFVLIRGNGADHVFVQAPCRCCKHLRRRFEPVFIVLDYAVDVIHRHHLSKPSRAFQGQSRAFDTRGNCETPW